MTLPLVAEVRAARERADRAVQATVLLQRALALETSMGLVGPSNTAVPEQLVTLFDEAGRQARARGARIFDSSLCYVPILLFPLLGRFWTIALACSFHQQLEASCLKLDAAGG